MNMGRTCVFCFAKHEPNDAGAGEAREGRTDAKSKKTPNLHEDEIMQKVRDTSTRYTRTRPRDTLHAHAIEQNTD